VTIAVTLIALSAPPVFAQNSPAQEFQARFDAGDYRGALKPGAVALAQSPDDGKLRLSVANALAWTGRYDAAVEQYERLVRNPEFSNAAKIGMANVLRWRGAPQAAMPLLDQASRSDVNSTDVSQSLKQSQLQNQRELRANTGVKFGRASDSTGLQRIDLQASQRLWQTESFFGRPIRWDLAALVGRDTKAGLTLNHREVALGIGILPMGVGPRAASQWGKDGGVRLEVSAQNDLKTKVFGRAHVDLLGDGLSFRAGRVNWGRQAFSLAALQAGLTANQLGVSSTINADWLQFKGRVDSYTVSDTNRVIDAELGFVPGWQPLPGSVQWFTTIAHRKASRVEANYWSPKNYTTAVLGVKRSWYFDQGELNASLGRSFALSADAKNGFVIAANGKVWVGRDTSLALDLWASDSPRVGTYRYNYVGVSINQLW
jgi:tetratricopeptide (TPR) repeat protein